MKRSKAYLFLWAVGIRYHNLMQFADECYELRDWYAFAPASDLAAVLVETGASFWDVVNVVIQPATEDQTLHWELCRMAQYQQPMAASDVFDWFERQTGIDASHALRSKFPFERFVEEALTNAVRSAR